MSSDRRRDDAIEALCRVAELMGGSLTVEEAGRILDETIARHSEGHGVVATVGHKAVAEAIAAGLRQRPADD